ncbi:MAG: hypothetical protein C0617_01340 [Desulfuromonas sp.]|uniref:type II secretion system F family protein n=1 Tax=Desulfuromonas sp. TaxID=892 RepID=UPI000CB62CA9|nr:type II secretion system F family protein [Desulfuromonas sp.]PLX86255.1 MAG: hypothetical protein C0617_01340 [Desulfuromonas sp.]
MDLLTILLLGSVFLFTTGIMAMVFLFAKESRFAEKRTIKKRLYYISAGGMHGREKLSLYRNKVLQDVGVLERLAFKLPRISRLDGLLIKARVPINASTFILASLFLGGLGLLVSLQFLPQKIAAVAIGCVCLLIPYFMLRMAERSYYAKFDEQLPEALDLLSRAMKSGHALTSGLEMIVSEMENPIKSEFSATVDEIKLGLTLQEAFDNLCDRVPTTDLRFFAVSVQIQKETGGNLTEILDNISRLIRDRVQFDRQVRALTAEGRLSAVVLVSLPLLMFLYIYFVNYEYISLLWKEEIGRIMLYSGIVSAIVGAYLINKIVTVEM